MKTFQLKNSSPLGAPLVATFLPEGGMNLCSYRLGEIEVIDQTTRSLYEERMAGLGALIGPHFHHRKGIVEHFSHGVSRYAAWKFSYSETQIKGELHGDDTFRGKALKEIEGQDFSMHFEARLLSDGLFITYKVSSEKPSVVGLHYYYACEGKGRIHGMVQKTYRDNEGWKSLPKEWTEGKETHLSFSLPQEADFGFIPEKKAPTDHDYHIHLDTKKYALHIDYNTTSKEEISCQIYQPKGASFVCIEPLSARVPREPILTESTLEVKLQITPS